MKRAARVVGVFLLLLLARPGLGMTPEERREYRERLLGILPKVPAFEEWVRRTDELPPDFDALPKVNGLPDPLTFVDGRRVGSAADWRARRGEILELFQKYAWGSIPPHPKLERAEVMQETAGEGYRTRNVVLHFGPEGRGAVGGGARLRVSLVIPEGKGPFPVMMGPGLVGGFGGGSAGAVLRRGYIAAGYSANDGNDDSVAAMAAFPGHDAGALPRRAWAARVVVDYLATLPEVDMRKVAIYGYSRDGKQATIAGALDERISAVVAGSTGVGGVLPYRLAGERNQAESIQSTTMMFPDWFHPRLRYFSGREDRLPVDGNLLVALLAPRPCLMISGLNDEVANNWGDEQSLKSAEKAYALLGAQGKLGIHRLPGYHGANDMEVVLDFLDMQFGRSGRTWTNQYMFPWDYEKWRSIARVTAPEGLGRAGEFPEGIRSAGDHEKWVAGVRRAVSWTLGEAPAVMAGVGGRGLAGRGGGARGGVATAPARGGARGVAGRGPAPGAGAGGADVPGWVIQRSLGGLPEFAWAFPEAQTTASRAVTFGQNVRGTVYYPANVAEGTKMPTVIWLHSYSYPLGYMWVYRRDMHPILALVKQGYAVLAYDQVGFGSRMGEGGPLVDRYPQYSLIGRMVEDVRAAVGMLAADGQVDGEQIWLYGYAMGGNVALHAAALEPRVKGVVSFGGFTPMRTDTAEKGTGGLARYSVERPLMPRLGLFIGKESQVPYDYDELMGAIAPRPVLVVQPQIDRDATPAEVKGAVERARRVYAALGAGEKLSLEEPWDYNRLATETQEKAIGWMKKQK